jgi:hypothetical protein
MNLRFYKKNNRWYADVPEHTEEENEMVLGADSFLEKISEKLNKTEITVSLSDEKGRYPLVSLIRVSHDDDGADYKTTSRFEEFRDLSIWICNVTHDVFGEHPEVIYIYDMY